MPYRKRHNRWNDLDSRDLLEELRKVRESVCHRYSSSALFVKPLYAKLDDLCLAIDAIAEQLTGDKEFFWLKAHGTPPTGRAEPEANVRPPIESETAD